MNKNLFKRVICLVIALMMIMPNMPMNSVRAEEEILTNLEEPSVESPLGDETPGDAADEQPAGEPQAEEPPAEEPQAEEPPAEEPSAEEPSAEQPPTEEPPIEEQPIEEPPIEEQPIEEPPVDEPPVDELPTTSDVTGIHVDNSPGEVISEELIDIQIPTTLTINHILIYEGEEETILIEKFENQQIGSTVYYENYIFEDQELEFLFADFEELILEADENQLNLYYKLIVDMGDNSDGLDGPEYIDAPDIYYPDGSLGPFNNTQPVKRQMKSLMSTGYPSDHDNIEPPAPGSLDIIKYAEPVAGTSNRWKVTLELTGKNLPTTSDIVLVIDRSGSMEGSKMTAAKDAATQFVNTLLNAPDNGTRIAVVSFAGDVAVHNQPTPFKDANNKQLLLNEISGLSADGGTYTQAGIRQAKILLDSSTADNKSIVLLSDGRPTYSYAIKNVNDKLNSTYFYRPGDTGSNWYNKDDLAESVYDYNNRVGSGGSMTQRIGWTSYYYHNGNSAVGESRYAKTTGYTIYSVGLEMDATGQDIMDKVASPGKSYTSTAANLQTIFLEIAGNIAYAATNLTIIDPLGTKFSIPGIDASNYNTKININRGTLSWNNTTETMTWTLPTVSEGNPATMWYEVEIDSDAVSGQVYPTNGHTYVTYTNAYGTSAEKSFSEPEAGINAGTIKIHYYRVNASGQPINSSGVSVAKEQAEMQVLTYMDGISLELNTPYEVIGPPNVIIGGANYNYNSTNNVGDTNPTTVTLTTAQPSAHVWFAYTEAGPEISVTGYEGVYDGAAHTITVGGTVAGDTVWYSTDGGATWSETNPEYTNVGEYPVKVKVTNPNYEDRTGEATVKITKAPVTITVNDASKVYGTSDPAFTGTVVGLKGSDSIGTVSYNRVGSDENVGTYPDVLTASYTDNPNYEVTVNKGDFTITKATSETLTVTGYEGVYDGAAHTITVGGTVAGDTVWYSTDGGATWSETNPEYTNVGEYPVKVKVTNPNYEDRTGEATVKITKAVVVVKADSDTRVYNGEEQTVTGYQTPVGLLTDHVLSGISANGSGTNVGNYPVTFTGTPVIKDGDVDVTENYDVTLVPGNLEVTPAPLIDIIVEKYWNDNDDGEGPVAYSSIEESVRPSITFRLWIGDKEVDSLTLQNGETTGVFKDKPVYDSEGKKIIYTITEDGITGYDSYIDGPYEDGDMYVYVTNTIKSFTVSYDANGGTGTMNDENNPYKYNSSVTVLDNTFARSGYNFTGWNTQANGNGTAYAAGNTFTMPTQDVTLYAQWSRKSAPPNPPIVIPDPTPPLAELEKFDHFAYVIGYPEGDVRPLNNITREEVAMIFYRLLTDESRNQLLSDVNPFTDMDGHAWSNRAVSTLYNAGIIAGYPDGTFRPSDPITRAEFATIAAKFDKLELGSTSKFTDIFGHWAEKYITSSEVKGWIKGYPDMTFKPEKDITRAEAMTLINNVLERGVPEENIHPDSIFWPDNPNAEWYYEAVMEATNSHNYVYEDDGDELWTEIKPNKVWP